jgi:hypothetical protein
MTAAGLDEKLLVSAIKTELNRLGCYFDAIDSNWQTPALRKALTDFAARTHLAKVPDSPAPQLLEDLKARGGRICGPIADRGNQSNGRCVAKTCTGTRCLKLIRSAPPCYCLRPGAARSGAPMTTSA